MKEDITYALAELTETYFEYNSTYNYTKLNINKDVDFDIEHNISFSQETDTVGVSIRIRCTDGQQTMLAANELLGVFVVRPLSKVIEQKADGRIITQAAPLFSTFANVVIGALRGVWLKNLKGTALEKSILPLIPMTVVSENINRTYDEPVERDN